MVVRTGYRRTELGIIPEDWEVASVGTYLRRAPSYGIGAPATTWDSRFPTYLRITDITEDGRFSDASKASLDSPYAEMYFLEPGDIVFARTGASVGKSYLYDPEDGPLVFAGFLIRLSPDHERLVPAFLSFFAQSRQYWDWVKLNSMRTGQPGINSRQYAQLPIPLPPTIAEQEAIAEALSDADALIESLEQLIAKKRQIKQGVMQELLTGKKRLPGFEIKPGYKQTELGTIPEDWIFTRLGDAVRRFVNGGTPSTKHDAYWSGDIPWITGADILEQRVSIVRRFITKDAVANSSANVIGKGNVLLVSRTGVGKLAIAPSDIAISQDFTGIYTTEELLTAEYLFRFLDLFQFVLSGQNQRTSIRGITRETLSSLAIFFPATIAEQEAITGILNEIDTETAALRSKLDKFRQLKQGMMQELLTGRIRLI